MVSLHIDEHFQTPSPPLSLFASMVPSYCFNWFNYAFRNVSPHLYKRVCPFVRLSVLPSFLYKSACYFFVRLFMSDEKISWLSLQLASFDYMSSLSVSICLSAYLSLSFHLSRWFGLTCDFVVLSFLIILKGRPKKSNFSRVGFPNTRHLQRYLTEKEWNNLGEESI